MMASITFGAMWSWYGAAMMPRAKMKPEARLPGVRPAVATAKECHARPPWPGQRDHYHLGGDRQELAPEGGARPAGAGLRA